MSKVLAAIRHHAREVPDAPVLVQLNRDGEKVLSWSELERRVDRLAERFRSLGLRSLALYCDNSPDWIIVDLACLQSGTVLIPLPAFFSDRQLSHLLSSSGVQALLTDSPQRVLPLWHASLKRAERMDSLDSLQFFERDESAGSGISPALPPGTSKISFTSGSTGMPKGVCLGADQLERVACSIREVTDACAIERHLCVLPLSTLLENVAGVYAGLMSGAQVVTAAAEILGFNGSSGFGIRQFLGTLQASRANSVILIPQLLEALVQACHQGWKAPEDLRFMAVGGGTVSVSLLQQALEAGLPVYEGYGLSECGSVVSLNGPGSNLPGSLGRPLSHVRVAVQQGELVVEGSRFLGYLGDEQSWWKAGEPTLVRTGDLGSIDQEGFLHYQGRRKSVLVTSYGRNVMPEWIEAEVQSAPFVSQCFVFGNDRPFCVALLAATDPDTSRERLQAHLDQVNASLPDYARIVAWHRLPEALPAGKGEEGDLMTSNGRPRRQQIEARYRAELDALYEHSAAGVEQDDDPAVVPEQQLVVEQE